MSELVTRQDREGIAKLSLNRPETLNALSPRLFEELRAHLDAIGNEILYTVGKGRTNDGGGFPNDNQNYGMRVRSSDGTNAYVSFIFRNSTGTQWNVWNGPPVFTEGSGWHHIAVKHTFGDGSLTRAYVDGTEYTGTWYVAGGFGNGDAAPYQDNDDLTDTLEATHSDMTSTGAELTFTNVLTNAKKLCMLLVGENAAGADPERGLVSGKLVDSILTNGLVG